MITCATGCLYLRGSGRAAGQEHRPTGAGLPAAEPPALPFPEKPSIAVLRIANMSGDPEQEYFADGTVGEIIPVELGLYRFLKSRALPRRVASTGAKRQTGGGRARRAIARYHRRHRDPLGPLRKPGKHSCTGKRIAPGRVTRRMTATRRLAAILAVYVAGYSRPMAAAEEGTLERPQTPSVQRTAPVATLP
jgi:hypothetical protein